MTDLKNDIRAAQIKNLGPCPEYRGHCIGYMALFDMILIAVMWYGK